VILIIRHAEKPEDGDGLTPKGEKRAAAYVGYFKGYRLGNDPLKLTHIFAAKDSDNSKRPRLTIEPLAHALHSTIDLRFTDKKPDAIVSDLITHSYGKQILISWRHGKIPNLLKAFGADPLKFVPEGKWPEDVFDRVIELHFDTNGIVDPHASRLVFEHLLPDDEKGN